ncbi:MAG: IS30 family transposase [Chlamydiales bacterium]|jgi:IS30 family transposase
MAHPYNRLTSSERKLIYQHNKANKSISQIADYLGRSKSTISDELHRGGRLPKDYHFNWAQTHADRCKSRNRRKTKIQGSLESIILAYLFEYHCSPQQISGRLKREFPSFEDLQISHEVIYRYIYRSPHRKEIASCLRRKRKKKSSKK